MARNIFNFVMLLSFVFSIIFHYHIITFITAGYLIFAVGVFYGQLKTIYILRQTVDSVYVLLKNAKTIKDYKAVAKTLKEAFYLERK